MLTVSAIILVYQGQATCQQYKALI